MRSKPEVTKNDLLMKLRALAEKKQKTSFWGLWAKNSEKAVVGVVEAPKKIKRSFQQVDQNQVDRQVAKEEKEEDDSKQVEEGQNGS